MRKEALIHDLLVIINSSGSLFCKTETVTSSFNNNAKIIPRYVIIKYDTVSRQNVHIVYCVLITALSALHIKVLWSSQQAYEVGMITSLFHKQEKIDVK